MSARFWLLSLSCAGAALTGGLGLGLYATTAPRTAWTETALPTAPIQEDSHDPAAAGLTGPAVIHCKGCGPTLADRRMAADLAGWDGTNDPVWRDYDTQYDPLPADYAEPPAPPPVQRLPASVERFASGNGEGSWQSVMMAEAQSKAPAEETPADASASY